MPYTYQRFTDGTDETFDVLNPDGSHFVSIPFWDHPPSAEHAAKLIVDALNSPALELLRAVLPYAEAEAERAWKAIEAAHVFLEPKGATCSHAEGK